MSLENKVIWSEGMFLNPQHFQQQERYLERYVDGKCLAYGAYAWGVHSVEIDHQLLSLGKIALVTARGLFPDGTPFDFPETEDPPAVLQVPKNIHNTIVYLAVPVKRAGALDVLPEENTQALARHYWREQTVRDVSADEGDQRVVHVGKLRLRLLLESDDLSGYACIGLLRIAESREDDTVLLDEEYIPSCIDCNASARLSGFLTELTGLLHHRGEAIAGRLADTRSGGTAEVADYMMLQLINRLEPFVNHLTQVKSLHPQEMYAACLQMIGELSTFVASNKRPPEFTPYRHDDLQTSFVSVMEVLRQYLSMVYEQTAIALELVEKRYGIRVAMISDRSLIGSASFVLAAKADVPEDTLRKHLPAQMKIGPVESIRQLVNAAMPGIVIKPLPVAPRQIPYHSGYSYFELERQSSYWQDLQTSGGFALHVGGNFPGLKLEFWAIRQQ